MMIRPKLIISFFLILFFNRGLAQEGKPASDSTNYYLTQLIDSVNASWSPEQIEDFISRHDLEDDIILSSQKIEARMKNEECTYLLFINCAYILLDHSYFTDAQKAAFIALKAAEKAGSKTRVASTYVTIGNIFSELHSSSESIKYLRKSEKLLIESGKDSLIPSVYNNISSAFYQASDKHRDYLDSAMSYNRRAIEVAKRYNDQELLVRINQSMGLIETDLGHYKEAEAAFKSALAIGEKVGDEEGVAYDYYQIGRMFTSMNDPKMADSAIFYLFKGIDAAKRLGNLALTGEILYYMANAYYIKKDYKLSAEYSMRYSEFNDSLKILTNTEEIAELSEKYQSAKKEALINQLNLEQKEQEEKINRQLYMIIGASVILLAVIGVVFVLYRSNKLRQKINAELMEKNRLIEEQKIKVEEQNSLIHEKNKEIIDSIRYAQRIQKALLPNERLITRILKKK
jgi:tetratricopeptide (TPR) repeat protein